MEKISGILPKNPRVTSVDMENSQTVRPGAPNFGQRPGRSDIRDRVSVSGIKKTEDLESLKTYKAPKEQARAKIAEEMARKFFMDHDRPVVSSERAIEQATAWAAPEIAAEVEAARAEIIPASSPAEE
jgi:hypothetical protein